MSIAPVAEIPRGSMGRTVGRHAVDWIPAVVIFVLTIVLWEGLVRALDVKRFLLPAPSALGAQWESPASATQRIHRRASLRHSAHRELRRDAREHAPAAGHDGGCVGEPVGDVRQLVEEHRDAMVDFSLGWRRNRSRGDLRPAHRRD